MALCKNCRWWVRFRGNRGECRFFPPFGRTGTLTASTWPLTKPTEWCGQFKPKGSKLRK